MVYKSDQERAAVAVIQEAIGASVTPDDPYHRVLLKGLPETSAAEQSASNSRAERAVRQIENMVRTYKCAIHPNGLTPYAALRDKNSKEKRIEFGERVL